MQVISRRRFTGAIIIAAGIIIVGIAIMVGTTVTMTIPLLAVH